MWRHTFNELRVVVGAEEEADEDVCGVVMTESVSSQHGPKQTPERMNQWCSDDRERMTLVTHSLCSPQTGTKSIGSQ